MVVHAALRGGCRSDRGRFNRKGEPALYLSLDVMTSFGECTQGFTKRLAPLTMREYDVDCEGIADLRDDPTRTANGITRDEPACPWLTFQLAGKPAPSWLAIDRLRASGQSGILIPSFVPGATEANINLVLWRWGPDVPHQVDVFDPTNRLPVNQLSWPVFRPWPGFRDGPTPPGPAAE